MRAFVLIWFAVSCYLVSGAWYNSSELQRMRDKYNPPHNVIVEKLMKKLNCSEKDLPNVYYLSSDEIPSSEKGYKTKMTDLEGRMKEEQVIPNILTVAPKTYCRLIFSANYSDKVRNHSVLSGNYLDGVNLEFAPYVSYRASRKKFYSLVYVALDVPHRGNPCASPFLQWLVVNIPGNNVSAGETLARWVPPGGERKGHHRHAFLIYKQPNVTVFDKEPYDYRNYTGNGTHGSREVFFPQDFSARYNFGDPWAGNFFMCPD